MEATQKPDLECKVGEGFASEFFKGNWLPVHHTDEFIRYCSNFKSLSEVLSSPTNYKCIFEVLLESSKEQQISLFPPEDAFRVSLDNLAEKLAAHKKLYMRWTQEINGKKREVSVPNPEFRNFIEGYILPFIKKIKVHPNAHGGERVWTPKKSLLTHVPIGAVLSFDMTNAFKQITLLHVFDFFYSNLNKRFSKDECCIASGFLAALSTVKYGYEAGLPMGSPLSNPLFNRLLYPIDKAFYELGCKEELTYSRWVDDLIVSSHNKKKTKEELASVLGILHKDFPISPSKVFYQHNPAYLLGHRVSGRTAIKIESEEGNKLRGGPLEL